MADSTLYASLKLATKDYNSWQSDTRVLKYGEPAVAEIKSDTSNSGLTPPTFALKIGDGSHQFKDLKWIQSLAGDVPSWAKATTPPTTSSGGSSGHAAAVVVGTTRAGATAADCDFLCDGTNDAETITNAAKTLSYGGKIILLEGEYFLQNPIFVSTYQDDVPRKAIWVQGCGFSTKICVASSLRFIFQTRDSSIAHSSEFICSDLTICNNENGANRLLESQGHKRGIFRNILFTSNYTIPNEISFGGCTYTYTDNVAPPTFFTTTGNGGPNEFEYMFLDCIIATDAAFTFYLYNSIVRNLFVAGTTDNMQTFDANLYSDVEINAYTDTAIDKVHVTVNLSDYSKGVKSPTCNVVIDSSYGEGCIIV